MHLMRDSILEHDLDRRLLDRRLDRTMTTQIVERPMIQIHCMAQVNVKI